MPLARNASGLLRRAAGFIASCLCCKKWKCDTSTHTCTEDPAGTYASQTECEEACQQYACNTDSYTCFPEVSGPYAELIECQAYCQPEKHYCCGPSPDDRACYTQECEYFGFNSYGVYDTPEECEDKCKVTHYKCNTDTYDCTEDPAGPYTDLQVCKDNCKDSQYYCCQSPGGPKECHLGGCPIGMSEVGGPYVDFDECDANCKPLYYCCQDSTGTRSCHPDECPSGTTTVGVYTDETECNDKCPVYYVCAQKTPYPVDGYECVAFSDAIDPSVIVNQYDTPDCDGECPPDPVYFCCKDDAGVKDCYKYGCPPDQTEDGGPYSTPRECSSECGVKYYCCEDSDGNKTCRDDECEYYGENAVSGPYDTLYDCEPECEKYYCCEDSNGERNCYKGNCPAGTEEKGGPYDDDVACKEAACAKVYWYCTAPDACASGDSGPYDSEDACLDGAPEDCKEAYTCQDNGDGTKTCVQDPDGEYDTDDCGGNCNKPKKYSCVDDQCVPDDNGGYDDPNCDGACTKQKYACVNGVCEPDDNGPYDEPTCGKQCGGDFVGGCCTEYGLSYVSRDKCKEWGGTFYEPGAVIDCDCNCSPVAPPATVEEADMVTCGPSPESGFLTNYFPTTESHFYDLQPYCFPGADCSVFDELREKNAIIIGLVEVVATANCEASDVCCTACSTSTKYEYLTYVYNCRTKTWETAPNVLSVFDTSGSSTPAGAFCGPYPAPVPPVPEANTRRAKPRCAGGREENPLP